jgi:hypothetical protein
MMKAALFAAPVLGTELKWATFDGASATTAPWQVQNDPVMGGGSTSDFNVTSDNTGVFEGNCRIVSFLNAPGFAKLRAKDYQFADVTGFENLALKVKSSTPDYQGFKISIGAPGVPNAKGPSFGPIVDGSYKADFALSGTDWQVIEVPLTQFSYDWSSYTGRCDSKDPSSFSGEGVQHECCPDSGIEPSNPDVCVDSQYLSTVNDVEIWAEGVEGEFNLEIEWVGATKADLQVQV